MTESELLEESVEILTDKKSASKQIAIILGDTAKAQGVDKPLMSRAFGYLFTEGHGWQGSPLEIDPTEKYPDKISLVFIKLKELVEDLAAVGQLSRLDPYIEALGDNFDIAINKPTRVKDPAEVEQAFKNAAGFMKTKNALDEQLKEEKAQEAEEINLSMKSDFSKVLSLYDRKSKDKDVDDTYQDTITRCEMLETAFNKVYDESLT